MTVLADTPVTIPLALPTVAFELSLQLHVPPVKTSLNVVVAVVHTVVVPVMAGSAGSTSVIGGSARIGNELQLSVPVTW